MKYPLTKPGFKLQFLGLVGKICIAYYKENKLPFATPVFRQQNEKRQKEHQQRLPQSLGCGLCGFVRQ